ncbi:EAL domain-containing protein [Crenothrix sp.]|uniref:EAL domain-containing protein n=1 Tax=Crenothrix sp. TaxID=3100433 RepID=UPI00374D98A5
MDLLTRPLVIETLKKLSENNDICHTLIYIEINNTLQITSLLQGMAGEEELISAIQTLIFNKIGHLPDSYMGKLSWNRFAIIVNLPVKTSVAIAEDLAAFFEEKCIHIGPHPYYPKIITGVIPLSPEYRVPEKILTAVDEALYQARRTGNNAVKVIDHNAPIFHSYYDSLKRVPVLKDGLINNAFLLYAQPIVPLNKNLSERKAEILVRYKDPEGEVNSDYQFVKTANLFRVGRDIDLYVVQQFCRFMQQQKPTDMIYSLNISGFTVRFPPFLDIVKHTFKKYGVNPEQVCFEITETVIDRDYPQAIQFMHSLKQLGCQLALDDIGMGSSNLANLPKFNVDFMKIDGAFINNVLTDPYCELVVNFITSAAKLFNKKTIAEYIETPQQLEKIKQLGVDYAQGFLTGRPELLFDPLQNG